MTDPTRIYDDQHNNAPAVPQDMRLVPVSLLQELESSMYALGQGLDFTSVEADRYSRLREFIAATPAPAPAPFAPDWAGYRQGLEDGVQSAADLLKRMAVELVTERGETDPDTGAIQFKSAATREWHASLCELAEEIERLKPAKPAQEVGLTDGWISVGDRLPDGELGYPAIEFYNEDLRNPTRQVIGIYRDGDWFSGGHQFSNVTYWKPLTPAPLAALRAKGAV